MATQVISPEKKKDELTETFMGAATKMGTDYLKKKVGGAAVEGAPEEVVKSNPRDRRMNGGY